MVCLHKSQKVDMACNFNSVLSKLKIFQDHRQSNAL